MNAALTCDIKAIPKQHLAAIAKHVGDLPEIENIPTPNPAALPPGTALVHLLFSGVCHSDVALSMGRGTHQPIEPVISGHEGVGYVAAVGPRVGPGPFPHLGARVGVKFIFETCGTCAACLEGDEEACDYKEVLSITKQGTFQQYIVAPVQHLVPIPDAVALEDAAPMLCAGLTTYKAILNANLRPGDWVVIPGAGGGLGHLGVQLALAMNYRVVAIDTGEERRELMESYGDVAWIDFKTTADVPAAIKAIVTPSHVKAAIVTAGVIKPYEEALRYLGPRGTMVCVGLPVGSTLALDPSKMVITSQRIVGSSAGTRAELQAALSLVASGKVKVRRETRPLREIREVYEALERGEVRGRIVLDLSE